MTVQISVTGKLATCKPVSQAGFSFLEILVVMLMLALVATTVVALSPDTVNDRNRLNKIVAFINGVRDQAIFSRRTCGVIITTDVLQGLCRVRKQWQVVDSLPAIKLQSPLPDTLMIDQQQQTLLASGVAVTPQLIFLADGRARSFNWTFGLADQSHVLQGDMLGYLSVE